ATLRRERSPHLAGRDLAPVPAVIEDTKIRQLAKGSLQAARWVWAPTLGVCLGVLDRRCDLLLGERWEVLDDVFHRLLASESSHHIDGNPGALDDSPLLVVDGIDPLAHGLQSPEPPLEILVDAREIEYDLAKRHTVRVCRQAPYGLIETP